MFFSVVNFNSQIFPTASLNCSSFTCFFQSFAVPKQYSPCLLDVHLTNRLSIVHIDCLWGNLVGMFEMTEYVFGDIQYYSTYLLLLKSTTLTHLWQTVGQVSLYLLFSP